MTVKEILDASKEKMSKSVAVYQNEMTSLRAGRANPRLLDRHEISSSVVMPNAATFAA